MSRLSLRFRIALLVVLLVSASAVGWMSRHPRRIDPCSQPNAMSAAFLTLGSKRGSTRAIPPGRDHLDLWVDGSFDAPPSAEQSFRYQIVRSYDWMAIGARPVSLVEGSVEAEHQRVKALDVDGRSIPVHIVEDYTTLPPRLIAYFHIHGLEPTESLFRAQLSQIGRIFGQGAPLLTTVIVDGEIDRRRQAISEDHVMGWIAEAWRFFDQYCVDAPKGP